QYFYSAAKLNAHIAAAFDHTSIRDDDVDGVFNGDDICSDTVAGASVDADGCSAVQLASDADGDGIHDYLDQCPNTPAGETPNAEGCSQYQFNADGDGIPNVDDPYPFQSATQCTP
ncbi:MAG: thrombospondin type 3 repeat-containing protein, partial [Arenicella sp.]|nr:thrombospondin type 3 repeat-containing protein [Arenicella sp.]